MYPCHTAFKKIFDIPLLMNLFIPLIEHPLKTLNKRAGM